MQAGDDVYLVERLLQERTRRGRQQFLVRWAGYSEAHDSWEEEANIIRGSEALIAQLRYGDAAAAKATAASTATATAAEVEAEEVFCFCATDRHLSTTYLSFEGVWVCCDLCDRWCHGECAGFTKAQADALENYVCPPCAGKQSTEAVPPAAAFSPAAAASPPAAAVAAAEHSSSTEGQHSRDTLRSNPLAATPRYRVPKLSKRSNCAGNAILSSSIPAINRDSNDDEAAATAAVREASSSSSLAATSGPQAEPPLAATSSPQAEPPLLDDFEWLSSGLSVS